MKVGVYTNAFREFPIEEAMRKIQAAGIQMVELGCGEESGFACTQETLVARVKQEKYCVGRFIDDGLKRNTRYFYRVRAVDKNGLPGPLSAEFSGHTKE